MTKKDKNMEKLLLLILPKKKSCLVQRLEASIEGQERAAIKSTDSGDCMGSNSVLPHINCVTETNYFSMLVFLICKMRIIKVLSSQVFMRIKLVFGRYLIQCLAHSKYYLNYYK